MLSLRIALRYLLSKKSHSAVNIISAISVAGVAVATAAIVVVLSVFNGFDKLAHSQFSHIDPDVLVMPATGKVMAGGDSIASALTQVEGVAAATAVLSERALIAADNSRLGVVFIGAGPGLRQVVDLDAIVRDGEVLDTLPAVFAYSADAVPAAMAVGVLSRLGSMSPVMTLYVPRRKGRINPANPAASLRQVSVVPTAMLQTDRMEFDGDHLVIPIEAARRLLGYSDGEASGIYVAVTDGTKAADAARRIEAALGDGFKALPREAQQAESFHMIAIEKWVTFMMLVFILIIATFNIVSTLSLMVIEKRDNMATLRFMGATRGRVRSIFTIQGALITLAGGALGIVLGTALSLAQQWGGFIKLGGDTSAMTIAVYPVEVKVTDLLVVAALTMAVAFVTGQITRLFTRKIE